MSNPDEYNALVLGSGEAGKLLFHARSNLTLLSSLRRRIIHVLSGSRIVIERVTVAVAGLVSLTGKVRRCSALGRVYSRCDCVTA